MKNKILLLLLIAFASCAPHREMVYLQDKAGMGDQIEVNPVDYRIKPNDILHIRVLTLDEESRDMFNSETNVMASGGGGSNMAMYIYGYSVNASGEVQLPVVGAVNVGGQTMEQSQRTIQLRLNEYLVGATVSVKMANFSFTVLGEVKSPGTYYVYDNEFTILDALGMAGDLTDYGHRQVNLVRRDESGLRFHTIDLTSRAMVVSELYYLQPGDVIYVEPQKVKRLGFVQTPVSLVFSAISLLLLIVSLTNN